MTKKETDKLIEYFIDSIHKQEEIIVNGITVKVISHTVDYNPPIELHKFEFSGGCSAEIERFMRVP